MFIFLYIYKNKNAKLFYIPRNMLFSNGVIPNRLYTERYVYNVIIYIFLFHVM